MKTCVKAHARIHLGFYQFPPDPRAWNGVGIYLKEPSLRVCVTQGEGISVYGHLSSDVREKLEIIAENEQVSFQVENNIPVHRGLGSTTQILLAAAKAVSYYKRGMFDWEEWVYKLGRHKTSRVGALLFRYGGLVIDGSDSEKIKPLYRASLPEDTRIIIVDPGAPRGLDESIEEHLWQKLPPANPKLNLQGRKIVEEIINQGSNLSVRLVKNIALSIDKLTGSYFSVLQGGMFRQDLINVVRKLEIKGVELMQSSWGPTLYTITTRRAVDNIVRTVENAFRRNDFPNVQITVNKPRNKGAYIERS